jgi:hypothetical protein
VAAQASTPGPDSTYNALVAIYSWSSQNICYANNGTATPGDGSCTITQGPSGTRNIAVCVQVTSAAQQCDITQINDTNNNYALVIQRINQQGTTGSCSITPPCQNGTQRASISQTADTGFNFGGVIQKVTQSLTEQATDDDPGQNNQQDVRPATGFAPGLQQTSVGGSNYAAVAQSSQQWQGGSLGQTQTARQFAGVSGSENGINQITALPGGNAAVLGQVQKQNVQSQVALSQTENAYQDGDITQHGGAFNFQNFASGNQFQDQQEQGVVGTLAGTGTHQIQLGDPKCCSALLPGGVFPIVQMTNMFANNAAFRQQRETIIGNCIAPPSGCTLRQSATVNGTTTPGDPCNAQLSCHSGIVCVGSSCTRCTTAESVTLPPCSFSTTNVNFGNRALAIAQLWSSAAMRTPTARPQAVRSGPSVALLT